MAKAFYGIDVQGKFLVERRTAAPSAEEGRIYLRTDTNTFYGCADGSNNRKILIEDGGTYNINISGDAAGGDADTLDGLDSTYFRNASNLNAGTVPVSRLSGTYNINISGNAATADLADAAKYS